MHPKSRQNKMYYFSEKLKKELVRIPFYPLTVIEAPSGFGKTTAVREYLRENLSSDAQTFWYICLGEPASQAWKGICELLENASREAADNLKKLEAPTLETLTAMMKAIRGLRCETETFLVIDNYQLMRSDVPRELMSVFSMHGSPNLHMIFITQQLGARQQITVHNDNIHAIGSSAFFFDREGTASLLRMEGIRLADGDLERVHTSTEGWVSAIRLQIINYEQSGSFDHTADIEHLVEAAIWNKLTPDEKDFLLSVSVMDSFTARQAAIMLNLAILPDNIEELLKYNDFIRYFPDKGVYIIHNILLEYLRNRFYHHQPQAYQRKMIHRAGQSFAAISQYFPAAQFFFKVEDFEAILIMPFTAAYLGNQKEKSLLEFFAMVVKECPDEILCKYPHVMLLFAYLMILDAQTEVFQRLYQLIDPVIAKSQNLGQESLSKIKGEFELLKAMVSFNDIRRMSEGVQAAWDVLDGTSSMRTNDTSWTFGCPSVLFLYWSKTGELDSQLQDMDEFLPLYRRLRRGHGCGADSVMRAEAMLMMGEDDEAEILCHQALYESRSHQQISISMGAELVLACVAILRGDVEGYSAALGNIQGYAKEHSSPTTQRMVDLCMAFLSLSLGITDHVAQWLYDIGSIREKLYVPAVPYAQILYSKLMLMEKRYNELYGMSQLILDTAQSMHSVLPQIYHNLHLAAAKHNGGRDREAQSLLNHALDLSLPDKIYLPFAQQIGALEPLLEAAKSFVSDREGLNVLIALCKRQAKGADTIKRAMHTAKSPLTPREREVALLARDRLSAREIAERLYISEATVKTILKNAYNKLNIHSKSELNFIDF